VRMKTEKEQVQNYVDRWRAARSFAVWGHPDHAVRRGVLREAEAAGLLELVRRSITEGN
jgi:hypothetical protein